MAEIYLVGGTTARTDLDNYVSANISEENAIASMRRWQDYQEGYEDYHIDHIEIDDIAEHDSELLDKVAEKLKAKYPPYFNEFGMSVNDTLQKNIDEVIAELKAEVQKGAENEQIKS